MVKAVNKLILEINNTENEYFEKAVFYVRPEMSGSNKLRAQAQLYLGNIGLEKRKRRINRITVIAGISGLAAGAAVSLITFLITGLL